MEVKLLGIAALLLIAWLYLRWRAKGTQDASSTSTVSSKDTAYHAVSIKFEKSACAAAKEMQGRRFLSSAAPRLPLPDCDALTCSCRFTHHKDRRSARDRRSPFGAAGFGDGTGTFEKERRQKRDRREDADLDDF